jgi:hypothetical protein
MVENAQAASLETNINIAIGNAERLITELELLQTELNNGKPDKVYTQSLKVIWASTLSSESVGLLIKKISMDI